MISFVEEMSSETLELTGKNSDSTKKLNLHGQVKSVKPSACFIRFSLSSANNVRPSVLAFLSHLLKLLQK